MIHFEGGYGRANRDDGALRRGKRGRGEERRQGKREGRGAEGRDRENPGLSKRSERHSEKGGFPRRGAGRRTELRGCKTRGARRVLRYASGLCKYRSAVI